LRAYPIAVVTPTSDLDDIAGFAEVLVDGVRVGDEVASTVAEQLVDRCAVMTLGVAIQHVLLWRDEHPEVAVPARFHLSEAVLR
jgi:hypothetical protein